MENVRQFVAKYQIVIFFLFSAIIGYWPWWLRGEPVWFMLGMPLTGIVLVLITQGKKGFLAQLKSAVRLKAKLTYYLGIIGVLLASALITLFIAFLIFGDVPGLKMIKTEPHMIPVLMLSILFGGPIFEEVFGLRGYALPQLLKKRSPLISSIIIGMFFGAWHLVEFVRPGSSQYAIGLKLYPVFILAELGLSTIMTWFYIRSKENLFLAGVFFHWIMNSVSVLFLTDITFSEIDNAPAMNPYYFPIFTIMILLFAIIFAVRGKMYLNPNKAHRRGTRLNEPGETNME